MTTARTRYRPPPSQGSRFPVIPLAIGAVIVVLAVGLAIALAGESGESGESGDDDGSAADLGVFGPMAVDGTALPGFTAAAGDPAVGQAAPTLTGVAPDGSPAEVGGSGEPTLIAFLAHWCPHCQAEVPVLVDLAEEGALDGVRTVAVLTGTDEAAPNFPPAEWLVDEGWAGDVLLDDEAAAAAAAYGLAGYPFLVVLDGEGQVVARASGELPGEAVVALVDLAREA